MYFDPIHLPLPPFNAPQSLPSSPSLQRLTCVAMKDVRSKNYHFTDLLPILPALPFFLFLLLWCSLSLWYCGSGVQGEVNSDYSSTAEHWYCIVLCLYLALWPVMCLCILCYPRKDEPAGRNIIVNDLTTSTFSQTMLASLPSRTLSHRFLIWSTVSGMKFFLWGGAQIQSESSHPIITPLLLQWAQLPRQVNIKACGIHIWIRLLMFLLSQQAALHLLALSQLPIRESFLVSTGWFLYVLHSKRVVSLGIGTYHLVVVSNQEQ